jgi:hypothetical protein
MAFDLSAPDKYKSLQINIGCSRKMKKKIFWLLLFKFSLPSIKIKMPLEQIFK